MYKAFPLPESLHCYQSLNETVSQSQMTVSQREFPSIHISLSLYNSQKEIDHQYPTVAKILVLDTGKFEQWQFRIQQYLQHEHYTLWEVIEFGDSYKVPTTDPNDTTTTGGDAGTKSGRTVTITTEDKQRKKNDAAILKTFGGNEVTKKRKKNLLKYQYGNFKAEGSETLEQTFNRLQVIVSQLQFMNVEVEQDDFNQKFLTSLAPEWLMHTIVWRNRNDLDTMSLDDLYNNLKVYESELQKKSDPNSQNIAFISSSKHSNGNEDGNTAYVSTASTNVPTASVSVATISQDTASAYIASQSSGSQIKFEDINQIDEDDMEEIDIKWSMALLSMRADKAHRSQERGRKENYRQGSKNEEKTPKALMAIDGVGWDWSYMANEGEDHALVADEEASIEFALMANTESKVFDNSLCLKDCKKNNDSLKSKITDLTNELFKANNYIYHYKLAVAHLEGRLVEYKEREVKYIEKIRTPEFYRESNKERIKSLNKQLETLKLEKDRVDGKLPGFLKATKNLDNLIEKSDKIKDGVRYNDVPPPAADLYLFPKKDLSWTGLPEFPDDTVTDYSRLSPTVESTLEEGQNKNSSTSEDVASPITPKPFVKFMKSKEFQSESKINKKETPKKPQVKYAEQYRQSNKKPNVRGNQRNWNNLKSYQLGPEFVLKKKACFNCGDFTHLANDCRKKAHSYETRPFHKTTAMKTQYRAPWVPTVNRTKPPINRKFSIGRKNFPTANRKFPTASRKFPTDSTKIHTADMGRKEKAHMTGNISYLSDFEPFDGGYVSFGQGGCKITSKGTIKTDKLEFENVYFMKDLKYNLFSVSQICDNKNSVLFTDSECIVLGRDFKLLDDANILLRTPRQHNMYSIDLNNIVPHRDLTCLVAKSYAIECTIWHRRLGHLNVKTMNKLVRHNLVRGLPTKSFDNDHTCTACLKGKQHKASLDAGTNSTNLSGTKDATNQEVKKDVSSLRYISLPNWVHDALLESSSSKPQDGCSPEVPEGSGNANPTASTTNPPPDQMETLTMETSIPTVSSLVPTDCLNDSPEPSSDARLISKRVANQEETPSLDNSLSLTNQFEDILGVESSPDEAIRVEDDVNHMETTITASPTPTLRIHKDHPKSQIIGPMDTPIQTRHKSKEVSNALQDPSWVEAIQEELFQFKIQNVWTLVDCPKGVRPISTKWVLKNKKDERGIVVKNKARLGLWYPKESPFDLVAYSDSDYGGATQDHKSTTGGSQFLGRRLISWQCKKQTIVATSTTEAEYVAAASCCGQVEHVIRGFVKGNINIYTLFVSRIVLGWGIGTSKYWGVLRILMIGLRLIPLGEYNIDFHPMVDFIAASPLRYALTIKPTVFVSHIRQFWSTARIETTDEGTHILSTVDGIQRTVSESSLRRNLKLRDEDGISSLPDTELFENLTLIGYNISQNQKFTFQKATSTTEAEYVAAASCCRQVLWIQNQLLDYGRVRNAQSSALPTIADEPASLVRDFSEGEACPTDLQRQHSELLAKFQAQEVEILKLKDRVKVLEDREGIAATRSRDDAPIKRRSIDEREAATERISDDSEELARVLTSMDAATVFGGGIDVPTGSGSIPTAGPLKGKEVMVESDTPKKQRLQEQIDAQVARELEEQQEREDKRMTEQIARDAEVAKIHAEEELQGMIDSLDRTNETIAKYLHQSYPWIEELS
nr:ribonuclease H-like domain-containing protein [Tanacetum cinerariifolium]